MERVFSCVVVSEFIYIPLFRWNVGHQRINVFLIGYIHAIMHPSRYNFMKLLLIILLFGLATNFVM